MQPVTRSKGRFLRRFRIEAEEQRIFLWAVSGLFLLGFADVAVQNAAETFFLKRVGVEYLPLAFLASTFLLIATTNGLARFVTKADRSTLLPRAYAFIAFCLLPLWVLVHWDFAGGFILLLFASGQIKIVALLAFWVVMGDLLHARQAKRLFAPLMGGITLGTIAGSFSSDFVGLLLGIDGVVYFSAAVIGLAALSALPLGRGTMTRPDVHLADGREEPTHFSAIGFEVREDEKPASIVSLWRESVLFRSLFVITVTGAAVAPMLYFQISFIADQSTRGTGGEQELLALYAQLRGWMNVAVFLFQVFLTSALYQRIGVPLASLFSPGVYLLSFVGLSIQMSLPVGIAAFTAVKLQEKSVQGPGVRILYSLFPDTIRSRSIALLEGPIRGAGGVLGNLLTLGTLAVGTAAWVGYVATPIALFWFAVALFLWREYPRLLIDASVGGFGGGDELQALLDPSTLRVMHVYLTSEDPHTRKAAADLLSDWNREIAAGVFAEAAAATAGAIRSELIGTLDRLLESQAESTSHNTIAADALEKLLGHSDLAPRDHALLIRAYGRLANDAKLDLLQQRLEHPEGGIRLAAAGALRAHGATEVDDAKLNLMLAEAVQGDDDLSRRIARRELRELLITGVEDRLWERRLELLQQLLSHGSDMAATTEALADVALHHGPAVKPVGSVMLRLRDASDVRVRSAVMRFVGYAGLQDQAAWLVEGLGSNDDDEAAAARAGFRALGTRAADLLIMKHRSSKRSARDSILSLVHELALDKETLQDYYDRELKSLQTTFANFYALKRNGRPGSSRSPEKLETMLALLCQRLEERLQEGTHAALFLLTLMHGKQQITELDESLRQTWNQRERALLIEAVELFLSPREKRELTPFLETGNFESQATAGASRGQPYVPSHAEVTQALLTDPDAITRTLARFSFPDEISVESPAAEVNGSVSQELIESAMHVKAVPLFTHLTVRQLIDLTKVVSEEVLPGGHTVFSEGDKGRAMYVIVEGEVEVLKGGRLLSRLGPGAFFGEMAVLEGEVRSASIVTLGATRLLRISGDDLVSLMSGLPAMAIGISRELTRRVEELSDRVRDFTSNDVQDVSLSWTAPRTTGDRLGLMEVALQLKSIVMFSGLETPVLMQLAQVVREESFDPGTVIVREDDYADCIYLVVEGITRIMKGETLLAEFGVHSFFGELALLGGGTRTASVVAKDRVRVLRLDRKELFRLMDRYPQIAIEICRVLSRRIRALNERLQS